MRNSLKATIAESTPDISVGTWRDFFFTHFKGNSDVNVSRIIVRNMSKFIEILPDGVGLITVISMQSRVPSREARKVMADGLAKLPIFVSAAIMEGAGFRAAAVRGFVSGLNMLAKQQYPHKFFKSTDDCIAWVMDITQKTGKCRYLTPVDLHGVIKSFVSQSS